MLITIKTHHVKVTKALKAHAEKKLQKLERFFDNIQEIVVDLDVEGVANENEQQTSRATIWASGTIIRATESSSDMYASIDVLMDKLEVQLKKHKEKLRNHKRGNIHHSTTQKNQRVVTSKGEERFIPKPMGVEDAVNILQSENLSFLMFRNLKERVCTVYPLGNNEIGLIES